MKKYKKYVLQCHSFRSQFTKLQYMCCIKSRHGVLESNFLSLVRNKYRPQVRQDTNVLWSAPSFLLKLNGMHFSLNSGMCVGISFGSDDSSAFWLLALLKGIVDCYTFQSTIFQQQFWNQARKLNYQVLYMLCGYSQSQCWWKTSSSKMWICFYDIVDMQPFFDW